MSDRRLRDLERRWKESGASEDWKALLREQVRSGTGLVPETASFLERLHEFCRTIEEPAFRAAALADVACAIQPVAQDSWALDVADEALAGKPERFLAAYQQARLRVAALKWRMDASAVRPEFVSILEWTENALSESVGGPQAQGLIDARNVLVNWWRELPNGAPADLSVAELGAQRLEALPTQAWLGVASDCWDALVRFGLRDSVVERARSVLTPDGLARLEREVFEFLSPEDAVCTASQVSLDLLSRDAGGISGDDARAYLACLRERPSLVDEFSVAPMATSFRATGDPLAAANELRVTFEAGGHDYLVQLVGIAELRVLIADGENTVEGGVERLEAAFAAAWDYQESAQFPRHRVITRLLHLVPALVPQDLQLAMVQGVCERAEAPESGFDFYGHNEVSLAAATTAARFASRPDALALITGVVDGVEALWQSSSQEGPWWLAAESLDAAVLVARDRGERALVDRAATISEAVWARSAGRARGDGGYFFARTLLRCAMAYEDLGDPRARDGCLSRAQPLISSLSAWDLTELLEVAAAGAGESRSLPLAEWTLRHAGAVDSNQARFCADLVATLAEGAVAPIRDALKPPTLT